MEIVRPASRRFWEEDKDDEVRVDPPVSPPARQRERRDPGRGREIGEVKIPAQDGQLQSGSSELRKLAFTVEAGGCYVALPYVSLVQHHCHACYGCCRACTTEARGDDAVD